MDIPFRIKILIGIFAVLTGVNLTALAFAMRANSDKVLAYEEKYALSSAVSDMSLATTAMTRLTRAAVVTGCENRRGEFLSEYERDRTGQAVVVFLDFDAPHNEMYILEAYTEGRALIHGLFEEALSLSIANYRQEAIDLAHSPELATVGTAVGRMSSELRALVYSRTQGRVDDARIRAAFFGRTVLVTGVLLVLAGLYGLLWVGRNRKSWLVRCLAAIFVVLTVIIIFLAVSVENLRRERNSTHELRLMLTRAINEVELSSESLKRLSRLYVVTGNEIQRDSYWQELERDRFLRAVDDFIIHGASDSEVNALVGLVYSFIALRQTEEEAIHLRTAGYAQEAVDLIFSPEADASFAPIGVLAVALREVVSTRTEEALAETDRQYNTRFTLLLISTFLLLATGFVGMAVKLRQVSRDEQTGYIIHDSYIIRRLKGTTIATRLTVSFSMIIVVFIGFVIFSNYSNSSVAVLNSHKVYSVLARIELIIRFHQEFTEMRRIARESFMNPEWRENTNAVVWRSFEQRMSESHARLTDFAMTYKDLVRADRIFPETPNDSRIFIMGEIITLVDSAYDIFSENFFLDGEMSFDHGDVLDYTGVAEMLLQTLTRIGHSNRIIVEEHIEYYRRATNGVTAATLATVLLLAIAVAYLMVNNFTGKVKALNVYADLVSEGNFEGALENKLTDELSGIFMRMVNERAAKMAERAEEESRAKTRFLAYMSHEIRTPMNIIMGIANIQLKKGGHAPEIEEDFSRIYGSSKSLLNIINDILDLSKVESGKMEIIPERYSVAGLISDTVQSHFMPIENKGLKFKLDIDENLPCFLIGDELRIKQILNNILSNAYKYTQEGEISLSFGMETNTEASGGIVLALRVGDTGQGMTEEQVATLFNAFVRYNTEETNHSIEGIGLGTTIAHQLASMMQGSIDVATEPDKGSIFTVRIPQKTVDGTDGNAVLGKETADTVLNLENIQKMQREIPLISYSNMSQSRVLVVDDVESNLYVVEGLLMPYGIEAETASNGVEAVNKIKNGAVYDIIFMDYMMPVMDGIKATKTIRETGYDRPIVALTANALKGAEEMFINNGFSGFLSKPIDINRFDECLVRFIGDKIP